MKNWSRKKNRIMYFVAALLIVFNFCSFSITSFAADAGTFYLSYNEPDTGESSGYISLLIKNDYGGYFVNTYFWDMTSTVSGYESKVFAYINLSAHEFNFTVGGAQSSNVTGYYHLGCFGVDGRINESKYSSSESFTESFPDFLEIVGYVYKGNVGYLDYAQSNRDDTFEVVFLGGVDGLTIQGLLQETVSNLQGMYGGLGVWIPGIQLSLDRIENHVWNLYKQVPDILNTIDAQIYQLRLFMTNMETNLVSKFDTVIEKLDNFLNLEGQESTEPLPDEEVNDVIESEGELVQDTTDAENNLSFSVDSNSNSVVWNIMERILNANEKVFGAFIGIMTLGVVTLLLNR